MADNQPEAIKKYDIPPPADNFVDVPFNKYEATITLEDVHCYFETEDNVFLSFRPVFCGTKDYVFVEAEITLDPHPPGTAGPFRWSSDSEPQSTAVSLGWSDSYGGNIRFAFPTAGIGLHKEHQKSETCSNLHVMHGEDKAYNRVWWTYEWLEARHEYGAGNTRGMKHTVHLGGNLSKKPIRLNITCTLEVKKKKNVKEAIKGFIIHKKKEVVGLHLFHPKLIEEEKEEKEEEKKPLHVMLWGPPNSGKSSLDNLVGDVTGDKSVDAHAGYTHPTYETDSVTLEGPRLAKKLKLTDSVGIPYKPAYMDQIRTLLARLVNDGLPPKLNINPVSDSWRLAPEAPNNRVDGFILVYSAMTLVKKETSTVFFVPRTVYSVDSERVKLIADTWREICKLIGRWNTTLVLTHCDWALSCGVSPSDFHSLLQTKMTKERIFYLGKDVKYPDADAVYEFGRRVEDLDPADNPDHEYDLPDTVPIGKGPGYNVVYDPYETVPTEIKRDEMDEKVRSTIEAILINYGVQFRTTPRHPPSSSSSSSSSLLV